MKAKFYDFIPLLIGAVLSLVLGTTVWNVFYFVFIFIGGSITFGSVVERYTKQTDLGRRVVILMIMPLFILFFGVMQRENMQIEETVLYGAYFLTTGIFTRVLIHYAIAKVLGPFIFGRGFCGWACWTAAVLEWLPIKENRCIPKKLTYIRIPVFIISIILPFFLISTGYDYIGKHINDDGLNRLTQSAKWSQFLWFFVGNAIYYLTAVILAFIFKKKRAFCKIACPVSLVMKLQSRVALTRKKASGKKCIECGKCNNVCPMDVDVMSYIKSGNKVNSTECIGCNLCVKSCPVNAVI